MQSGRRDEPSSQALDELVVAVLIAWIWLCEVTTLAELAGGLLVLGGVVIVTRGPAIATALRRPAPPLPPPDGTPET
jgi:hypothetical protein